MDKQPILYRKRLIPDECVLLKDDEILGKNMTEIRSAFSEWVGDDNVKFSSKEFKAAVDSVRNFEIKQSWIDGKNKKVYCRKE